MSIKLPSASSTKGGLLDTSSQTFSGTKTFTSAPLMVRDTTSGNTDAASLRAFGSSGNAYPVLSFTAGRGSSGSPTQTQSGDIIGSIYFRAYNSTPALAGPGVKIEAVAAQNWTGGGTGASLAFYTTTVNDNVPVLTGNISSNGGWTLGNTTLTTNHTFNSNGTYYLDLNSSSGNPRLGFSQGGVRNWELEASTGGGFIISSGVNTALNLVASTAGQHILNGGLRLRNTSGAGVITPLATSIGSGGATKDFDSNIQSVIGLVVVVVNTSTVLYAKTGGALTLISGSLPASVTATVVSGTLTNSAVRITNGSGSTYSALVTFIGCY